MMRRYETLILTVPEVTEDEAKTLERNLDKLVKDAKGSVVLFDKWGKYKLAYPVRKNEYGVYFLMRFELPKEAHAALEEIKTLFDVKMRDLVMRFMASVLEADAGTSYQRPPSLEDTPTRDVGTFIKENKMEGFLPRKSRAPRKNEQEAVDETVEVDEDVTAEA